ncbi:sodium:solute symporter [bacterium]|nr:sodium:solute symporter [bacterium]MCI0602514.1 sodium:solute symporter [bacterium]
MRTLDWIVLIAFLAFTVIHGIWKGRGTKNIRTYMLADKTMPWYTVALSIMATQASAITFLTTTGQAYADGMRFVQFYFGLPIAMVILCLVAVPLFHRLNVYTAYEYLEKRFDLKTRVLTGFLFLIQRGLSTSLSLFAPALILSVILGWDMKVTLRITGLMILLYTTIGGVKGVNWNDFYQFLIIAAGMVTALVFTIHLLPSEVSFLDAVSVAGAFGKLKAVDFSFDWNNRYNFWSGLIGGMFLALAYFGTDQSQVQRYLTGRSVTQSRLGLLFNGLLKIPMQFFILFVGAMVFVFYQFVTPPLFFNPVEESKIRNSTYREEYQSIEREYQKTATEKRSRLREYIAQDPAQKQTTRAQILELEKKTAKQKGQAVEVMRKNNPSINANDTNYVFLSFVTHYLPAGLVGLVIVIVFAATMASTSAEWNALATASVIDVYKRLVKTDASDQHYLWVSRIATAFWGSFAILASERASRLGTLVEAVNILGSLFYGSVLGIFILAFFLKKVRGTPAFIGVIFGELVVLCLFLFTGISFLWYNVFGCLAVVAAALFLNTFVSTKTREV